MGRKRKVPHPVSPTPMARNLRRTTTKKTGGSSELPSRLYAADCYPGGIQRLNIYAKVNVIDKVVAALQGHEELEHLRGTVFAGFC
ncbi:unnamed protein product [Microthlaspi erraticum]|uniref:Uncharacterized protein n=1 Tax=Microthlaspi erraticum TaxID=1685480 RepID=A0A6D2I1G3_9BRAS|nr:unnamed protein product [Microthlaspi erraticum]